MPRSSPGRAVAPSPPQGVMPLRVRAGRDRCPTAAVLDSQTVPAADTVPRSRRGWDGGQRPNGLKSDITADGFRAAVGMVVTARVGSLSAAGEAFSWCNIQDRDAAHRLLAAPRGSFSSIRLVWANGRATRRGCAATPPRGPTAPRSRTPWTRARTPSAAAARRFHRAPRIESHLESFGDSTFRVCCHDPPHCRAAAAAVPALPTARWPHRAAAGLGERCTRPSG